MGIEVKNCIRCGAVFSTNVNKMACPQCEKKEEERFQELRKYINEHPNAKLKDVASACNITPKRLMQYIREGRIEITKGMSDEVTCEMCDRQIPRGRYCAACISKIASELAHKGAAPPPPEPEPEKRDGGIGMHIFKGIKSKNKKQGQ